MKSLFKKAQESRKDLLTWYLLCFMIVIVTVGGLYGFGIIGNISGNNPLIDSNKITAVAIAVPEEDTETNTGNVSFDSAGG